MSSDKIRLEGPWPLAWIVWGIEFLGWMLWSPLFATAETQHLGLAVIFTQWALMETAGGIQNGRKDPVETELARTLSQILQRLVQEEHQYRAWYKGYPGLVTCLVAVITVAADLAFSPFHWLIGIGVGAATCSYLMFHLLRRGIYG